MSIMQTSNDSAAVAVVPPQNVSIPAATLSTQATIVDPRPAISVISDNPIFKYMLFAGGIYVVYKYIWRK